MNARRSVASVDRAIRRERPASRRRWKAAALAAALIGLGLALYRPSLVPALRPRERGAQTYASRRAISDSRPPVASSAQDAADRRGAPADGAVFSGGHDRDAARRAAQTAAFQRRAESKWPTSGPSSPGRFPTDLEGSDLGRAEFPRRAARPPGQAPSAADIAAETFAPSARGGKLRTPSGRAPHAPAVQTSARPRPGIFGKFFTGPAPPRDEEDADDENDRSVAGTRGGEGSAGAPARFARVRRVFPLFRPPRRSAGKARAADRRLGRPPSLARLLGGDARRPPKASISPPDLSRLDAHRPKILPDGGPVPARPFEIESIEAVDLARAGAALDRRRASHWHPPELPALASMAPRALLWHSGAARGVIEGDRWLWLWRDGARWWAAPDADSTPLLRHQGLWWRKQLGVWFALHEGELWSWRRFSQWDAEGLLRLVDGVQIVYSSDFSRVAVVVPGEGAVLYDAATGAELGRWREDELPRRHPRPPTAGAWPVNARLLRGI